jgi:small subunit ribosomal protein S21
VTDKRTWAVAHGPLFVSGSALSSERDRVEVTLSENDRLDFVLKKFRRQITKAGLFQDLKKKRFYESPSVRRRRKDKAAARRKVKRARRREQS